MKVQPIKTREEIQQLRNLLVEMNGSTLYRDVFTFLSYTGFRISDALAVRYDDVKGEELEVLEKKTGKYRHIRLHSEVLKMIAGRKAEHPHHAFLFEVETNRAKGKPVSRQCVSKAFKEAGERLGLKVGTHSGRKSLGYHVYQQNKDIGLVMKMLNHSNAAVTQAYIGITDQDVEKAMMNVRF
ncbi:tyrosine-type recombinase/integrase [Serratia rubidaea]|nr:tyrosine-type recombinase/integrase [Serratia rubidaea]